MSPHLPITCTTLAGKLLKSICLKINGLEINYETINYYYLQVDIPYQLGATFM